MYFCPNPAETKQNKTKQTNRQTDKTDMKKTLLLLMLTCSCAIATAQERSPLRQTEFISADSLEDEHELLERVRNMPNLEVGKGITFRPKSNWFSLKIGRAHV